MSVHSEFDRFLRVFNIEVAGFATSQQITEFEERLDFVMPPSLRACYEICNGGTARSSLSHLRLSSLQDAAEYDEAAGFIRSPFGYFAIIDNNDSDPICVCCKSPLTGYVVQFCHDGGPRLLFRSLDGFFRAASDCVERGARFDPHSLETDFDGPDRLAVDVEAAHQLIEMAKHNTSLEHYQVSKSLEFACDLLPDSDVGSLAGLLEIGDEYVRERVVSRLKQIPSEQARQCIANSDDDYAAFVERCYRLLVQEGMRASLQTQHGKPTIRIDPQFDMPERLALTLGWPMWVGTQMFYPLRFRDDFDAYFLDRIRHLIAQRVDLR